MVNISDLLNNLLGLLDKYYPRKKKNQQLHQTGVLVTDNNREVISVQSLSANSTMISGLSSVATTGDYTTLTNKPTNLSDFTVDSNFSLDYSKINNRPTKLSDLTIDNNFSLDYSKINNKPTNLSDFTVDSNFSLDYSKINNRPTKLSDLSNNGYIMAKGNIGTTDSYEIGEITINGTTYKFYGVDTNTTYSSDETTITKSQNNKFSVKNGGITTDKLGDGAVTSDKLNNGAITSDKISNNSITTDKISNNSITTDKIANGTITNEDISSNAEINANKVLHTISTDGTLTNIFPSTLPNTNNISDMGQGTINSLISQKFGEIITGASQWTTISQETHYGITVRHEVNKLLRLGIIRIWDRCTGITVNGGVRELYTFPSEYMPLSQNYLNKCNFETENDVIMYFEGTVNTNTGNLSSCTLNIKNLGSKSNTPQVKGQIIYIY